MGEGNKVLQRLTNGKKLQKDQYLIIILVGILLCVIAIPTNKKDSKSDLSNIKDDIVDDHKGLDDVDVPVDYVDCWEDKLEDALRYVEGVGKVRVLITLHSSEQKIVEKDGPEEHSETTETDAAGGNRTIGESRIEKNTIYTVDAQGGNVPYVVMTIQPVVEGVVVIAQMADRENIQEDIIQAIQVLFDIDANKIKIVKMKNKQ